MDANFVRKTVYFKNNEIYKNLFFKTKTSAKMFSNPLRLISSNIHYYERHSFFCSICKQRFLTEKNFNRHITSRKHIRQIQNLRLSAFRMIARPCRSDAKLDLLPNEVIEELIRDLTNQIDQKENFFNDIQLVDDSQVIPAVEYHPNQVPAERVESIPLTISVPNSSCIMKTTPQFNQPKLIELDGTLANYTNLPCLTCFQCLDSQQSFNEHMLKSHFNISIGNGFVEQ